MNKLESTLNGYVIRNPPATVEQVAYAKSMGARQLRSGKWVLPEPSRTPPLSVIQYGPGHTCRACKEVFRSERQRDRYCRSCRAIIDRKGAELTNQLKSTLNLSAEEQRKALESIEEKLTCDYRISPTAKCGWHSNAGRYIPTDTELILKRLPAWVARDHCHYMRHVFWNRFPYSPRFFPHFSSDSERAEQYRLHYDQKWRRALNRFVGDLEIELNYPVEGSSPPTDG